MMRLLFAFSIFRLASAGVRAPRYLEEKLQLVLQVGTAETGSLGR